MNIKIIPMDGSNECMQEIIQQIQVKSEGHWSKIAKTNPGEILDAQDLEIIIAKLIRMNLTKEVNNLFKLKIHSNKALKKTVNLLNLLFN
jgi:hypothetical protein